MSSIDAFPWRDAYATGIEAIDRQHRNLFDIVNNLNDAVDGSEAVEAFGEAVEAMAGYVDEHFKFEEDAMRRTGYRDLEAHRAQHRIFVRTVVQLQRAMRKGDATHEVLVESISFLAQWIGDHVLKEDQRYVPHFKAAGLVTSEP